MAEDWIEALAADLKRRYGAQAAADLRAAQAQLLAEAEALLRTRGDDTRARGAKPDEEAAA